MFAWLKRLAAPVAAIAVFALPSGMALADSVTFHTVAYFADDGNGTFSGNAITAQSVGSGYDSLSFPSGSEKGEIKVSGMTHTVELYSDGFPSFTTFASFEVTLQPTKPQLAALDGAMLVIAVYQDSTDPGGAGSYGPGTFVGATSAHLKTQPSGTVTDTVTLAFAQPLKFMLPTGATSFPPGVWYTIDGPTQTIDPWSTTTNVVTGNVAAVPLPGIAWAGMALLGGVGGWQKLRRRGSAVAA